MNTKTAKAMKKSIKTLTRLPLLLAFLTLAGTPLQSWGQTPDNYETGTLALHTYMTGDRADEMYQNNYLWVVSSMGFNTLVYTTNGIDPQNAADEDKVTVTLTGDYYQLLTTQGGVGDVPSGTTISMRAYNSDGYYTNLLSHTVNRCVPTLTYNRNSTTGKITITMNVGVNGGVKYETSARINSFSQNADASGNFVMDNALDSYVDGSGFYFKAYQWTNPKTYPSMAQWIDIHRYQVPSIERNGDIITVTNPNNFEEDGETTNTNTTLYWYTDGNADQPQSNSNATFTIDISNNATLTYHFYVGGTLPANEGDDVIFHSPELVTEIVPTASISIAAVGTLSPMYQYERITANIGTSIYYDFFPDGIVPAQWSPNTEDDYANHFTPSGGVSVTDAPDGAVYKFYRRLMREEKVELGTRTISTTDRCDGVGAAESYTVQRYGTPTVSTNNYTTPSITASLNSVDASADGNPVVKWKKGSIPTATSGTTNNTVNNEDFQYNQNFYFRTYGTAKFPTYKDDAAVVSTHRYNPPTIAGYDPFDGSDNTNIRYAQGTFESTPGTGVYVNNGIYPNGTADSDRDLAHLVDPNPSDNTTYTGYYPTGTAIPNSINTTFFKMVTSTESAGDATRYPSEVVSVDNLWSGYYVICKTDDQGVMHYLKLDSVSYTIKDTTSFAFNCLWFYDGNNCLSQSIEGNSYHLHWVKSGNNVTLSAAAYDRSNPSTFTTWSIDKSNHYLTADCDPLNGYYYRVNLHDGHWDCAPDMNNNIKTVYSVHQRHDHSGSYNAIKNLRVEKIARETSPGVTEQPDWFTMRDAGSETLKGSVHGDVVTYTLPEHYYYYFNYDQNTLKSFAFYKGRAGRVVNKSYPDLTRIPFQGDSTSIGLGVTNASSASLEYTWHRRDGLVRYQAYQGATQSLQFALGSGDTRTSVPVYEPGNPDLCIGEKVTSQTNGSVASNTITLQSLDDRSARTDTIYLTVKARVGTLTDNGTVYSELTATSEKLLVNYGNTHTGVTARRFDASHPDGDPVNFNNNNGEGSIYLLANCGDRSTGYSDRFYLTGTPGNSEPYLSNLPSDYRVFRITQVEQTDDGYIYYTIANVALHPNGNPLYLTNVRSGDCFENDHSAVSYLPQWTNGVTEYSADDQLFEIIPFKEMDGGTYCMIRPKGSAEGVSLTVLHGTSEMSHDAGQSADETAGGMEGVTLRHGNGLNSIHPSTDEGCTNATAENFPQDYFYGAYWQLVVPTLLSPALTMTPDGVVTLTETENSIRGITNAIKYTLSSENHSQTHTFTLSDKPVLGSEQSITYWKEGAGDYSYVVPSPRTTFTAHMMKRPRNPQSLHNDLTFRLPTTDTARTDLTGRNVTVRYILGEECPEPREGDPANVNTCDPEYLAGTAYDYSGTHTYDTAGTNLVRYHTTVYFRAYADNCLASPLGTYVHNAELPLVVTATTQGQEEGSAQVTLRMDPNVGSLIDNDYYNIYYTLDGSEPVESGTAVCSLYTNPFIVTGTTIVRAKAYPVGAGSDYHESREERYYHGGQFLSFWHVTCPECTTAQHLHNDTIIVGTETNVVNNRDFYVMHLNRGNGYFATASHEIEDSSFLFRGPAAGQPSPVFNGYYGQFFTYDPATGYVHGLERTSSNAHDTPTQWTWGGEQESGTTGSTSGESATHYTLTTTNDEGGVSVTRHLVYVDNVTSNPWRALTDAQIASETYAGHVHKQVAFRTDTVHYKGGSEISAKDVNLFIEDGNRWQRISTASDSWLAYAQGESVRLRASMVVNDIHYHSNIDINVHRWAFDDHNQAHFIHSDPYDDNSPLIPDPDQYVPWQQWHQHKADTRPGRVGREYCHYYWDVPGYSEKLVNDYIFPSSADNPCSQHPADGICFTLSSPGTYTLTPNTDSAHIVTLTRADDALTEPDLNSLLTVRYYQHNAYANEGAALDKSVLIRLFAERSGTPASISGTDWSRWRFVNKADPTHDHFLFADTTRTVAANATGRYTFLTGQYPVGISDDYTKYAVWQLRSEGTGANLGYYFKSLALPEHHAYSRPDVLGGLYLVDPDPNTNGALYSYIHGENAQPNPFAPENKRQFEVSLRFGMVPFYGDVVAIRTKPGSDYVYNAAGHWTHLHYGTVTGLASNATEADVTAACAADYLGCRWKMEAAPLTPPDISMDPSGYITLHHRIEGTEGVVTTGDNPNLKFWYRIFPAEGEEGYIAPGETDYENPETYSLVNTDGTLKTDEAILYDPTSKPRLTAPDQTIVVTAEITGAVAGFAAAQISQKMNHFVAVQTAKPDVKADSSGISGAVGTRLVVGIDKEEGVTHWNVESGEEGYMVYDTSFVAAEDLASWFQGGHVLSIIAWHQNELQSEPRYFGHLQDLTLAITGFGAVETRVDDNNVSHNYRSVTATLKSNTMVRPLMHRLEMYYTLSADGTDITHSVNYEATPPTVITNATKINSYTLTPETGQVKITFDIEIPTGEDDSYAPILTLRVFPELHSVTLYKPSNQARQQFVDDDYDASDLGNGAGTQASPYVVATLGDYLTVVNKINNGTAAADGYTPYASAWYKVTGDVDLSNNTVASISTFSGHWNGGYHTFSGLKNPMFTATTNAHIYNVVIDRSKINGTGTYTGAIVSEASGDSRIYNTGVRSSDGATTVTGTGITGGLVGYLADNSRVINCYNFANVESTGGNAGGIVGGQQNASSLANSNIKGIVLNCMNYGDVSANTTSGTVSPIVSGDVFTNNHKGDNGINTYNYYLYGIGKTGKKVVYNCARAAEEKYLTRFEFYRGILNSNLKKCGWWTYATSNNYSETTVDGETIGKWVLDKSIAPYPVVQPKYDALGNAIQYASVINPDFDNYDADKKIATLTVTVKSGSKLTHADETITLQITDMNPDVYDYNYGKVQLPYFQKVFGKGSYIQEVTESNKKVDYIVTGWDITAETTDGTVTYNNWTSTGTDNPYNFADRKCTDKDRQRTFAQGGYYNVPEGVTAITITAHWGKVVYLGATGHDYTYNDAFDATSRTDLYGTNNNYTYKSSNATVGKTVYNTLGDAYKGLGSLTSVYDQAIVVVSNCNLYWKGGSAPCNGNKPFTLMSLDEDNDCEPDYCCFTHFNKRNSVAPIRFDFVWMPGSGIAYKITNHDRSLVSKFCPDMGIWMPNGHFEITETALQHYGQFEYYTSSSTAAPLILNNGVIDQFCSTNQDKVSNNSYMILGGHVWFKVFAPGTHGDKKTKTKHCPVSVLGGDYEKFYLSGYFNPDANTESGDNVYFYANGGKFGEFASGGQERITGNVTIKADHIIADEFYGGGVNPKNWGSTNDPKYQVQGNITVSLRNSKIGTYAGTKFSSLMSGKDPKMLTTIAENTEFGTYYGAGIGGSGLNRDRTGQSETSHGSLWSSGTASGGAPNGLKNALTGYSFGNMIADNNVKHGVVVDYEMEMIPYSGFTDPNAVGRFYRYEASLSKANVNNVSSTLINCTINNNFYGGGFVGTVSGTATSTLTDCTIYGNVYAGGNDSDIPYIDAYDLPRKADNSVDVPWYDVTESIIHPAPRSTRVGRYYWKYDATRDYNNGRPQLETVGEGDDAKYYIYTNESFDNIGIVNQTDLTINGTTKVYGKVFGGGDEAPVQGTASVTVTDNAYIESDVFGGGNVAEVEGKTTVVIGETKPNTPPEDYSYAAHRPWVKGDVYGGGNEADVKGGTDVTIFEGIVGPVYGGGNEGSVLDLDATHKGNTHVKVLGGYVGYRPKALTAQPAAEATNRPYTHLIDGTWWDYSDPKAVELSLGRDNAYYGVFGGGYGLGTVVAGSAKVHVGHHDENISSLHEGTHKQNAPVFVNGSVYGGGEAGQVGGGYKTLKVEKREKLPEDIYTKANNTYVSVAAGTYAQPNVTYYKKIGENKYKEYIATLGEALPTDQPVYVFGSDGYPTVTTHTVALEGTDYYTLVPLRIQNLGDNATDADADIAVVTIASDGTNPVTVLGAAFGGGRGYFVNMVDNVEEGFVGNENETLPKMTGAMYGNTLLAIGTEGDAKENVKLHTLEYFLPKEDAEGYHLLNGDELISGNVYWESNLYVFNVDKQYYQPVTPGKAFDTIHVTGRRQYEENGETRYANDIVVTMNISSDTMYRQTVQYYMEAGRMSAAGGGEKGPVYGSTAIDGGLLKSPETRNNEESGMLGGNTRVVFHSGTLGDIQNYEVDGDVFGGGLQATVDGTATIEIAAKANGSTKARESLWIRGDTYAGGCLGEVYNYKNADFATLQTITGGWVRNAYGGSNFTIHNERGNTKLVVGKTNGDDEDVMISESVYGASAYAASNGTATMVMHSGRVGFVYANIDINTATGGDKESDAIEGEEGTIVSNGNPQLSYEGNVYGGGFGPEARATKTNVTVDGGIIRDGVFGGGEVASIYKPYTGGEAQHETYRHKTYDEEAGDHYEKTEYVVQQGNVATVTVTGGEMAMVCGGGRGYTGFLKVGSATPGAIMGDVSVTVGGNAKVRSYEVPENSTDTTFFYSADLGGGNIYGGGLEGIVTGNTTVTVTGNAHVTGNVFGGGRGYRDKMLKVYGRNETKDDITNRASRQAGWVLGSTKVEVKDGDDNASPTIDRGVYGGGEGFYYWTPVAGRVMYDTVANVHGNAIVDIHGGTLGGGYEKGHVVSGGSYAGGRVASVHGYANMHVYGSADVASVYGGNDISGRVFGKGRPTSGTGAVTTPDEKTLVGSRSEIPEGESANYEVSSTYLLVDGTAKVGHVYGGGNGKYTYYTDPEYFHLHFNEENAAPKQGSTFVVLRTTGGEVKFACGGGNSADVDTAQIHYAGTGLVDTLFAGGNSATVTKKALVKVNASGTAVRPMAAPAPANMSGAKEKYLWHDSHIDYLFGGNNQATMRILPTIDLKEGVITKVFGGGNKGEMWAKDTVQDVFGRDVYPISTYVLIDNNNVEINGALFGGCNNAVVKYGTFVDVRAGYIKELYGGNDVSEDVGNTRVDMLGGEVWKLFGGSNGNYKYKQVGGAYDVYAKNAGQDDLPLVHGTNWYPKVTSTNLNIGGGIIYSSIYGGGYAGPCVNTHVIVNDEEEYNGYKLGEEGNVGGNAQIMGTIYGGGYGDQARLGNAREAGTGKVLPHVGNVTGTALTDLYHVGTLTHAMAYGGGEAGDVYNSIINVYPSWNKSLDALYGGCWGSDVTGTATVNLWCVPPTSPDAYNIQYVYGGNDFTGTVNHSVLNVYDGRYQKVFGGGNGDYSNVTLDGFQYTVVTDPDGTYSGTNDNSTWPAQYNVLQLPNSQYPVTNIYGGKVVQNVYGGGNLGISRVKTTGQTSLDDYAFVQINIHGGEFGNDVFAGAAGKTGMNALVYGLKVLNMDGGHVATSVYGGSESVDDGYANECVAPGNTTLRPSSILNLVEGTVDNNVYGGGYLGLVHGSTYVNIGKQAVLDCRAYNRAYSTLRYDGENDPYKPHFVETPDESTGTALGSALYLHPDSALTLGSSVYAGANWGNTSGSDDGASSYMFTTPGFYGGESRIRIDGLGYNTGGETGIPSMDIRYSIIGSGTSCKGGDVLSDIRLLNYGKWQDCQTTKDLFSIQRADSVMFMNVGLTLLGDQDAYSAYPSARLSISRCDTVVMVAHNTLQLETPAVKLHHLAFRDVFTGGSAAVNLAKEGEGPLIEATAATGDDDYLDQMTAIVSANNCGSQYSHEVDECTKVTTVAGDATKPFSTLIVKNGAYIDVFDENEQSHAVTYYDVKGYGFLRAEDNTQAIVTARCKRTAEETVGNTTYQTANTDDGGFFGLCNADNNQMSGTYEFKYGNFNDSYRAWKFGHGVRMRQVAIVAHSDLTQLTSTNKAFTYDNNGTPDNTADDKKLAVAVATIELPPTEPGYFYELRGGINVDNENREMELVEAAWVPGGAFTDASFANGKWIKASDATEANISDADNVVSEAIRLITQNPSTTFGLAIAKAPDNSAFSTTSPSTIGTQIRSNMDCRTAINGNSWFDGSSGYATTTVDGSSNVIPKLNVYLTYDPSFSRTLMGDVTFTLHEMRLDASGNRVEEGSVEVTVSISTILTAFEDQEYTLQAMKNNLGIHEYSHKLILPAAMESRSLRLTAIEWDTVNATGTGITTDIGTRANFALTDITTATQHKTLLDNNTFALTMMPTEDLSATLTTSLGWQEMDEVYRNGKDISTFAAVNDAYQSITDDDYTFRRYVWSTGGAYHVTTNPNPQRLISLKNDGNSQKGQFIGILDGRSSAAIDFTLFFNDEVAEEYEKGTRGQVKLHFDYYPMKTVSGSVKEEDTERKKSFTVTLNIKTRDHGDTIYVASAQHITRDLFTIWPYGEVGHSGQGTESENRTYDNSACPGSYTQEPDNKAKEPMSYVRSFKEALRSNIYQEGDVICVLDTVYIDEQTYYNIHGTKGNPIPIIRYSGSHYQFPGAACAYTGPMVVLKQEGKFSCHDVIIDGRMNSSRKRMDQTALPQDFDQQSEHSVHFTINNTDYYTWAESPWKASTLQAVAPVFEVRDGGVLSLGDNTLIHNCWNAQETTEYYSYTRTVHNDQTNADEEEIITTDRATKAPGSVVYLYKPTANYTLSATGTYQYNANPMLIISDDLTIEDNCVGGSTSTGVDVKTGAIHLEEGIIEIGASAKGKKITITENYALPANGTPATDLPNTAKKANVFLNYQPLTVNNQPSVLLDSRSAFISVNNDPTNGTKIGISKEFPGGNPAVRDTMQVAKVTNNRPIYISHASSYEIFEDDNRLTAPEEPPFFYHPALSSNTLYFQRCATFRKQNLNDPLVYYVFDATGDRVTIPATATEADHPENQQAVLNYKYNKYSTCPDQGDSVIYSVHGGFYPYTYTWSWGTNAASLETFRSYTTAYKNVDVNSDLLSQPAVFTSATASNSDTARLYGMTMKNTTSTSDSTFHYSVTATDLAGCSLTKRFNVKVTFWDRNQTDPVAFSTEQNETWSDTVNVGTNSVDHIAKATRKYTGLYLIAEVKPENTWGGVTASYETGGTGNVTLGTNGTRLCAGDVINLTATGKGNHDFLQWDFDPYDQAITSLVMPNRPQEDPKKTIMAYFGPKTYWKDVRTTDPGTGSYETKYWGSVHIKDEQGLAWLISVCNGLNGQQIRTFYFDTVFIHAKSDGQAYNMSDYLWTPLGTANNPFDGVLKVDDNVTIKGIIVNEPQKDYAGFFGFIDSAYLEKINLSSSIFRGQQYVGAIAAQADHSTIESCTVADYAENIGGTVTLLTTNYASGGIIGRGENSAINKASVKAKFMGECVYNGGLAGTGKNLTITGCSAAPEPKLSALYVGGAIGNIDDSGYGSGEKSFAGGCLVNNYVRLDLSDALASRVGGLVGYAKNATLANNYVYGTNRGATLSGALGAVLANGVHVENCFYEQGFDRKAFGYYSQVDTTGVTSFSGSGSNVILTDTLGNNVNLTRQLNRWVYAHGDGQLSYWHSDTGNVNNGYPLFGEPEYEPFEATRELATCDSLLVAGLNFTTSGTYYYHVVDSAEFTDTAVTLYLTVNYSELTEVSDTIRKGEGYEGHGFSFTPKEIELMMQTLQEEGAVTVVVSDTLQTETGCDSIVTLYLTVSSTLSTPNSQLSITLKVYPNPTTKSVTVEADGLQQVELYDAVSRRLDVITSSRDNVITADLEAYPAGPYYLRIRTENGTVIKKVIKR